MLIVTLDAFWSYEHRTNAHDEGLMWKSVKQRFLFQQEEKVNPIFSGTLPAGAQQG